jgi:hypothetical protein
LLELKQLTSQAWTPLLYLTPSGPLYLPRKVLEEKEGEAGRTGEKKRADAHHLFIFFYIGQKRGTFLHAHTEYVALRRPQIEALVRI